VNESTIPLGEVADVTKLAGFEFTKYITYIPSGGVIAIRALNVKNGELDLSNVKRISKDSSEKLPRSKLFRNDLVLTYTGALCGKVALISENDRFHLAPNVAVLRPKSIDPYFLYSYLRGQRFKSDFDRLSVGSTQKTVPMKNIRQIPIPICSQREQRYIGQVACLLDTKIRTNKKMNQTLEEIVKAIFNSWFVDFDPVRAKAEGRSTGLPPEISDLFPDELVDSEIGEIPKGWDIAPLDQIGNFRNGLAMQKYPAVDGEEKLPVVKIAQLRKGSTDGDDLFASGVPSDYVITDGDYVFSWSGSLMAKYWVGGKGALNQHLFKVEEKTQPLWFIAGWVEHFMPEFQSIAESKATTMGHIKREHLKQAICAIPSDDLIERSAEVIRPLIERSILNQQESTVLSELRDMLLPKLITGELRIPDAEKFLEEAGI